MKTFAVLGLLTISLCNTLSADEPPEEAAAAQAAVSPAEHKKNVQAALREALSTALKVGTLEAGEAYERQLQAYASDPILFGERSYASTAGVKDEKVEFYLPEKATDIQLFTQAAGHFARCTISEADFQAFLVKIWERYRSDHAKEAGWESYSEEEIARAKTGSQVGKVEFRDAVKQLGWKQLKNAVQYPGPRRRSYAGADYFYDRDAGIAYHDAGYW
ncbi:MAG: hypothetical protein ACI8W8_002804 [Rhodothermales bacterium]|jgi:hypothetical protein